jgi:phosphatidylinositol glycan class V
MKPSTVSEETRSLLKLSVIFLIWKSLLFFLAITSPGRGYDTSTSLLLDGTTADASFNQKLIRQLTRWDSIYFVSIAQRGYLFEQEWAFGWGFSQLVSFVTRRWSS